MPGIFISYRRADTSPNAGRLYDRLSGHFGADNVFKDVDNISAGQNFRDASLAGVRRSDVMLVLIGQSWDIERLHQPNDLFREEIELGLGRDDFLVVPILVGNASMPKAEKLPDSIRSLTMRNALRLRDDPDFHKDADRIISHIKDKVISSQTWSQRGELYASSNASPFIRKATLAVDRVEPSPYRDADLRLLKKFWRMISSRHVRNVISKVNYRGLTYGYYQETFSAYLDLREHHPENHFIDEKLERVFSQFDEVLAAFDSQLFKGTKIEFGIGDEINAAVFVPVYKKVGIVDQETYDRLLGEYLKILELGSQLEEKHAEVVRTVQHLLPEFDFTDEPST
jgi:hypothetical protein